MKELTAKYLKNPDIHQWIADQVEMIKTANDQENAISSAWKALLKQVQPVYCQYAMYRMHEQTTQQPHAMPAFCWDNIVEVFDSVAEIQTVSEELRAVIERVMQYSPDRPFQVAAFTARNIDLKLLNDLFSLMGKMLPLKYTHGFSKEYLTTYNTNITDELINCQELNKKFLKGNLGIRFCINGNIKVRFRKFTFVFDEFLGEYVF